MSEILGDNLAEARSAASDDALGGWNNVLMLFDQGSIEELAECQLSLMNCRMVACADCINDLVVFLLLTMLPAYDVERTIDENMLRLG